MQAAFTSMGSFATGAALPLLTATLAPASMVAPIVAGASLCFLAVLGAVAARAGGAPVVRGAVRVTFWGTLAMGLTAAIGALAGTVI